MQTFDAGGRDFFPDFAGNENIKRQLGGALRSGRIAHCYMISGDKGLGKQTLAKRFAKVLMCESDGQRPCGSCRSCRMVENEDHPDVLYPVHEKPTVFSVDEVRDFSRQMSIRPYRSDRKIFIFRDAQLLNVQAQNAMLKTIEEPPEYGMVILLTDNKEIFLPTVLSRCVELNVLPVGDEDVRRVLAAQGADTSLLTRQILMMAGGNIGLAKDLLTDEVSLAAAEKMRGILSSLPAMSAGDVWQSAQWMAGEKEIAGMLFAQIKGWFRDVNLCKAGGEGEFSADVRDQASMYGFDEFPRIFSAVELAEKHRKANVNPEISLELMLTECKPQQ